MPWKSLKHALLFNAVGTALLGALLIGLVAIGFAVAGDHATTLFDRVTRAHPWVHLVSAPLIFVAIVAITSRVAPDARGSGIPQVIAASRRPGDVALRGLVSIRTALFKAALTVAALFGGGSVGREGPTVQLGAAIMVQVHRLFRVNVTAGVYIAGGAAGVADSPADGASAAASVADDDSGASVAASFDAAAVVFLVVFFAAFLVVFLVVFLAASPSGAAGIASIRRRATGGSSSCVRSSS